MVKKLLKKEDGFTLVELLAVIVILAIIAAIAIPAIGHIINNSRNKAEVNNALQIIDAAKLYVTDNNIDISSAQTIDSSKLASYLNGQTTTGSYTVYVTPGTGTDTSVTYSISGTGIKLPSDVAKNGTSSSSTEQDLLDWLSKNGGTPPTTN